MNQSTEAAESGTGGWMDAVTYMAGLSGGSWATATYIANGGQLPTDMVDNVSLPFLPLAFFSLLHRGQDQSSHAVLVLIRSLAMEPPIQRHLPRRW